MGQTSKIDDTVNDFLCLFSYFSPSFIKQCQMDCMMLQNLAPLKLALYVLYVNSISKGNYTILVYGKNETLLQFNKNLAYKELYIFKNELINLRQINFEFISKARYFKHYYSSFESILIFQSFTQNSLLFFKLTSFFSGSKIFFTDILNPKNLLRSVKMCVSLVGPGLSMLGSAQSSYRPFVPHPTVATITTKPIPELRSSPFRGLPRLNSKNFSYSERKTPILCAQLPITNDQLTSQSEPNITILARGDVNRGNIKHYYHLLVIDGELYFSLLGIHGRYKDMPAIMKYVEREIKRAFVHEITISDIMAKITEIIPNQGNSSDHTATQPVREVFKISKQTAHSFVAPGLVINGLRTNNLMNFMECSEYDFRPNKDYVVLGQYSHFNGNYTFRSLYIDGLETNFLMWIARIEKKYPEIYALIRFFIPQMYEGFLACCENDLEQIDAFLNRFDTSVDEHESVLIFQLRSLTVSKETDIKDLLNQLYNQNITTNRIITKPRTIEVFLESAAEKHKLGYSLQTFLSNHKFWKSAEIERKQLIKETQTVVERYLVVLKNTKGTKSEYLRIQSALDKFNQNIKKTETFVDIYSAKECLNLINTEIKLGYFYPNTKDHNGRNCDYTVETALNVAKQRNEDKSLYVQDNKKLLQSEKGTYIIDNFYTNISKENTLVENLDILKSRISERALNMIMKQSDSHHQDLGLGPIAFPNPNQDVHKWLIDNLHPKTLEFLEKKTKIHKSQGAIQPSVPNAAQNQIIKKANFLKAAANSSTVNNSAQQRDNQYEVWKDQQHLRSIHRLVEAQHAIHQRAAERATENAQQTAQQAIQGPQQAIPPMLSNAVQSVVNARRTYAVSLRYLSAILQHGDVQQAAGLLIQPPPSAPPVPQVGQQQQPAAQAGQPIPSAPPLPQAGQQQQPGPPTAAQ